MSSVDIIVALVGIFLLLLGILIMTAGQFYLMNKIGKVNVIKAYFSLVPFILLFLLNFDGEIKKIGRDYPRPVLFFTVGLIMTILGIVILLGMKLV